MKKDLHVGFATICSRSWNIIPRGYSGTIAHKLLFNYQYTLLPYTIRIVLTKHKQELNEFQKYN